jgi:hypothetical protein
MVGRRRLSSVLLLLCLLELPGVVRAAAATTPAVPLHVSPERAPAAGTLDISCSLPSSAGPAEVVVADAYRGSELTRLVRPPTAASEGLKLRLRYSADPRVVQEGR